MMNAMQMPMSANMPMMPMMPMMGMPMIMVSGLARCFRDGTCVESMLSDQAGLLRVKRPHPAPHLLRVLAFAE